MIVGIARQTGDHPVRTVRKAWRNSGPKFVLRKTSTLAQATLRRWLREVGVVAGQPSTLTELCGRTRTPSFSFAHVNAPEIVAKLVEFAPDIIAVAAFNEILKPAVLAAPRLGCVNVHPSLLPAYRGPNPLYWVIKNREPMTGVTVHYMDAGIDTGDIIVQQAFPINVGETERSLRDRCLPMAGKLLVQAVHMMARGDAPRLPQSASGASYYGNPPRGASSL
jgi:methionyl-tRNA formyltransferase